tara:strand:+ start:453 stop:1202 length:750 start_codon:yes stop_codon:yes gene_type:complete
MSDTSSKNFMKPLSWHSYGITDVGKMRKHNEDSLLESSESGMWLVADGMGGHTAGDVASQLIVNSLKKIHKGLSLERYIDDIEDALICVNEKLIEKGNEKGKKTIVGSTVVIMLAYDKYCIYLWAGDSRLYRLRDSQLQQMTIDHSQVEQYIEQGLITREEAIVHPHGNMITRAVGATSSFFLDMGIQEMKKGDRYLLCSDGLNKHTEDFEFQEILGNGTVKEICKEMIEMTLNRGAGDNTTAIVIDID